MQHSTLGETARYTQRMNKNSPAGLWRATRGLAASVVVHAGWRGAGAAGLVAVGALFEGLTILMLLPILAVVTASGHAQLPAAWGWMAPIADWSLGRLLLAFLGTMIVRAALLYRRDVVLASLQTRFVESLRLRLIVALAAAPWRQVLGLRHAELINLLTTEVTRIAAATHHLVQGGVAAVMLAAQIALALSLAPEIAGLLLALLAVAGLIITISGGRTRTQGGSVLDANRAVMESSADYLAGLKIAATQADQPWFVGQFRSAQRALSSQSLGLVRQLARGRLAFSVGAASAGAILVWLGVNMGVTASVLVTLIVVFARMVSPGAVLQGAAQNLFHSVPSFEAVVAMESRLAAAAPESVAPTPPPSGPLVLSSVTYRHAAAGGGGVSNVSLTIGEGEFLGITGPSGAGKTTLIDLMAGLMAPEEGEIAVGNTAFDAALRAGWRRGVAYVPQDGFLFHHSVRSNLVWDRSPDDDEIANALALTGGDRVVAAFEQGLDTIVGERGARLSGGERQRLALSRALLRRPRLMILDEATSALDVAAEREILTRLAALSPRPTIVIVAHRSESLALCDRVIRVEAGQVIA